MKWTARERNGNGPHVPACHTPYHPQTHVAHHTTRHTPCHTPRKHAAARSLTLTLMHSLTYVCAYVLCPHACPRMHTHTGALHNAFRRGAGDCGCHHRAEGRHLRLQNCRSGTHAHTACNAHACTQHNARTQRTHPTHARNARTERTHATHAYTHGMQCY